MENLNELTITELKALHYDRQRDIAIREMDIKKLTNEALQIDSFIQKKIAEENNG